MPAWNLFLKGMDGKTLTFILEDNPDVSNSYIQLFYFMYIAIILDDICTCIMHKNNDNYTGGHCGGTEEKGEGENSNSHR